MVFLCINPFENFTFEFFNTFKVFYCWVDIGVLGRPIDQLFPTPGNEAYLGSQQRVVSLDDCSGTELTYSYSAGGTTD